MHFTSREWYFSMKFFFEEVKNYVQVCSEKGLKRFVQPKNYKERVVFKFWEEKLLLKFFQELFLRTACLINFDKVVKSAFNLSRGRCFPFFIGKSDCYKKGSLRARSFRQSCQNCILLFQSDILGEQFFMKEKKIFFVFFSNFLLKFFKISDTYRQLRKTFSELLVQLHSTGPI